MRRYNKSLSDRSPLFYSGKFVPGRLRFSRVKGPFALILIGFSFVLIGCSTSDEENIPTQRTQFVQNEEERSAVLNMIDEIDISPFHEAFQNLPAYDYTRYQRTEQYTEGDFLVAFRERTVRHSGKPASRQFRIQSTDSTGTFDFGFFRSFVSANVDDQDPENLTPYLFPEDPAYLSDRNYEAYLYRLKPDTLMRRTTARVVEVRAKPKDGDGKNIRRARYFFDKGSGDLIGFQLERIDLALFFREESAFYAHVQRTADGRWVPYNTRFETRIIMPFKPAQRFKTVATYSNFQ